MAINLLDITANNNDLTNSGAAEISTSLPFVQSTTAVGLTASESDYLSAADSASLSVTGDFTVEFWVKFTSLPTDGNIMGLVSKWLPTGNQRSYRTLIYNASGTYKVEAEISLDGTTTTRDVVDFTVTPSTDTWYHYAITCDISQATATTFEMFVGGSSIGNGTAVTSGNCASIFDSSAILVLGKYSETEANHLNGQLDDIRIWSDIRTITEIANNKDIELVGDEAGLVAYWPFESTLGGSASASVSASASQSLSPSSSMSASLSQSSSISASLSPSASVSSSASESLSLSPSPSTSSSISASPSQGYSLYSRQVVAALPTGVADLDTLYTEAEEATVSTRDNLYVGQLGGGQYLIHQYKVFVGAKTECKVEWEGKSTLAPSTSTVYLQVFNYTTGWETVDSEASVGASEDFELEKNIPDLTDYKDPQNVIVCRVYQLAN